MSRTSPVLALAYARANMRARRLRLPATIAGHRVVARSRDPDAREAVQHYHTVTRAGFSTRGDTALVTVSALCGMLCGSGETVLVVRTPRGWRRGATVSFLNY